MQLTAKLSAKDERIEALTAARKVAEQAAAFVELDGARRHAMFQMTMRVANDATGRSSSSAANGMPVPPGGKPTLTAARRRTFRLRSPAPTGASTLQEGFAGEKTRGTAISAELTAEQNSSLKRLVYFFMLISLSCQARKFQPISPRQ